MKVQKKGSWFIFDAPSSWVGLSIEQAFRTKWFVPKKMLHEWRMTKGVAINDRFVPFHTIISAHDRIRVRIKEEHIEPTPTYIPLHIIFEDEHVLVINKPAHMDVHPTHEGETNTLANAIPPDHRARRDIRGYEDSAVGHTVAGFAIHGFFQPMLHPALPIDFTPDGQSRS